ncbi:unnamed protein product [Soboliphyme baturini]|uniref:Protein-tyrosine-phosphatase n=1 Tax=Soboliphyme baturini TaxID=241478 RepID=A0A183IUL2_9BILA|nr:unnamed protein product [Soboliphyme baturini]
MAAVSGSPFHNECSASGQSIVPSCSNLASTTFPAGQWRLSSRHLSAASTAKSQINGYSSDGVGGNSCQNQGDESLVTIRMTADAQGRFGFNVKGGIDDKYPISVSRVVPGSPADTCIPRLNEGDQILMINQVDVSLFTHDQAVRFIRSCREIAAGQLVIVARPNGMTSRWSLPRMRNSLVPQAPRVADCVPRSDILHQSLLLLRDSLASGAAIVQFEKLYRRKPAMSMKAAREPQNASKNRYRDVSPYDDTRVVIRNSDVGDYINASYINMEIPGSGIVNRYIAGQGPLPHTTSDFWQVVWEQLCATIVMLTATTERGRAKCHQYWPNLYETQEYGVIQVTCVKESETKVGSIREILVVHRETGEERLVTHMQYVTWPDHGVPEDSRDIIDFIVQVRHFRAGMVEPLFVHCSAGIGRTGVLILVESAMCLIEANEPVYPLDIVRTMRDQRAMLIQTSAQYKFACETILRIYNDCIVKPSAEYQR